MYYYILDRLVSFWFDYYSSTFTYLCIFHFSIYLFCTVYLVFPRYFLASTKPYPSFKCIYRNTDLYKTWYLCFTLQNTFLSSLSHPLARSKHMIAYCWLTTRIKTGSIQEDTSRQIFILSEVPFLSFIFEMQTDICRQTNGNIH